MTLKAEKHPFDGCGLKVSIPTSNQPPGAKVGLPAMVKAWELFRSGNKHVYFHRKHLEIVLVWSTLRQGAFLLLSHANPGKNVRTQTKKMDRGQLLSEGSSS